MHSVNSATDVCIPIVCTVLPPPIGKMLNELFKGPEFALMRSLQIRTAHALDKVVHAVGLWP